MGCSVTQDYTPFIVGLGGSTRPGSTTERAVAQALAAAAGLGARTELFGGPFLARLSLYEPGAPRSAEEDSFVAAVRAADGIIVGSPGYHGSLSGLIKNALDHLEETARDTRVYLDGRAFGCIVTAHGWQAGGTTLVTLRTIAHALRAWPTPLGVMLNSATPLFSPEGDCIDDRTAAQLALLGRQVVEFARWRAGAGPLPGEVPMQPVP